MVSDFYNRIIAMLSQAGIESPRLEARLISAYVCQSDSNNFNPYSDFSPLQCERILSLVARRIKHEPLDKILGYRDFYKYRFRVNKDVLSPRPDSEILVETSVELIKRNNFRKILELGVGSGCLLLSVLADMTTVRGVGADISVSALSTAQTNANDLKITERVKFLQFDYFKDDFSDKFDLIIANPPYIPTTEIKTLMTEVKNYDPISALDGGEDGLYHYRQIAKVAGNWLNNGGYIVLEVGIGQAEDVIDIFTAQGWKNAECRLDLAQVKRCVILQK